MIKPLHWCNLTFLGKCIWYVFCHNVWPYTNNEGKVLVLLAGNKAQITELNICLSGYQHLNIDYFHSSCSYLCVGVGIVIFNKMTFNLATLYIILGSVSFLACVATFVVLIKKFLAQPPPYCFFSYSDIIASALLSLALLMDGVFGLVPTIADTDKRDAVYSHKSVAIKVVKMKI